MKIEPHNHQWKYPVKHADGVNYEIGCAVCPTRIKITAKQFEQGGYKDDDFKTHDLSVAQEGTE